MIEQLKALLLTQEQGKIQHQICQLADTDLPEGDVLVAVNYSSLNYMIPQILSPAMKSC